MLCILPCCLLLPVLFLMSKVSARGAPGPSPSVAGIEVNQYVLGRNTLFFSNVSWCRTLFSWWRGDGLFSVSEHLGWCAGRRDTGAGGVGVRVLYISTRVSKEPFLSSQSSNRAEIYLSVAGCPDRSSCSAFRIASYNSCSWFSCMKRRVILRLKK